MKRSGSYVVRGILAAGVLYYALRLSAGDRGLVDGIVLGVISLAIAWNVLMLSRRLRSAGGGRDVWHVQRTVLFWILGAMNAVFPRPEDVGSWKYWIGWVVLVVALIDSVLLYRKERALLHGG